MDINKYITIPQNLALTIKKEQRLSVIKKITRTALRMSCKTLLYLLLLTIANIIV